MAVINGGRTMFYVKSADGIKEKAISRVVLEQLRMLMDWQLRQLGYCPASVTAECQRLEGR
jgi:hypothetical protein